ncbi:LytR C-terminal domain-containing protein [Buchananella felis]|uniref:LytR C-terminal domain-containing protein n=1 Tax=Buchananella felis TaxID=3231492 RepID=UPI003526FAF9
MPPTLTPKQQRKQALQRRQTMIYGALLVGMSAVGVGSFLVATGAIQGPFDVGFTGEERPYPGSVVPCPPQDATALPYGEITVNVYNGSPLTGLATLVSSNLEGRGFTVEQYGNYIEESYPGTVLVQSGLEGVRAAYTVAQLFDEPVINVDARPGATVEIVLGKKITSMNDVASPTAESTPPPLQPARGCVPFESLTAEKLPPIRVLTAIQPSETATPTETTKAE